MLIVTIHDVAPPHLAAVTELRARTAAWGVRHATLLAVPNHHGAAPLEACPATSGWLRARADLGDEIALHGVTHRQDAAAPRRRDRLRARVTTAGEGEMLGAGAADPSRLAWARATLEELIDAPVHGFVAPAWLEPPGLGRVLGDLGFAWHETALAVERLGAPRRRWTPVIGFATRTACRERAALGWAAALGRTVELWASRTGSPIRLALHPGDLTSRAVMGAAERLIRRLAARHPTVTTSAALGCA